MALTIHAMCEARASAAEDQIKALETEIKKLRTKFPPE
jgi:hypothetical protein